MLQKEKSSNDKMVQKNEAIEGDLKRMMGVLKQRASITTNVPSKKEKVILESMAARIEEVEVIQWFLTFSIVFRQHFCRLRRCS